MPELLSKTEMNALLASVEYTQEQLDRMEYLDPLFDMVEGPDFNSRITEREKEVILKAHDYAQMMLSRIQQLEHDKPNIP